MSDAAPSPVVHIALIGCGRMGAPVLKAALALPNVRVSVIDPYLPGEDVLGAAKSYTGLRAFRDARDRADMVMFAAKPQQIAEITEEFRALGLHRDGKGKPVTVASILAGVRCRFFASKLGSDIPVIRIMPNIPMAVGYGMTGYYATSSTSEAHTAVVDAVFAGVGVCCALEKEELIDVITAVSGSGPAYFFYMAECMADAGERMGLPRDVAEAAAAMTLTGAGAMISEGKPAELRERVTSPGGTTAHALAAFASRGGLPELTERAMREAQKRAVELSRMTGE